MNINEYRDMSVHELENELKSLHKERFNLNIQKATRQLAKPHLINLARKKIARVNTILREKADK